MVTNVLVPRQEFPLDIQVGTAEPTVNLNVFFRPADLLRGYYQAPCHGHFSLACSTHYLVHCALINGHGWCPSVWWMHRTTKEMILFRPLHLGKCSLMKNLSRKGKGLEFYRSKQTKKSSIRLTRVTRKARDGLLCIVGKEHRGIYKSKGVLCG